MKNKWNIVACSDIHLRETVPESRTDDYWKAQWEKFKFILETAAELKADICCAGDLFDKAKSSPLVESTAIKYLKSFPGKFYVIPGQHDLPNHNHNNFEESSLAVLAAAGAVVAFETPFESFQQVEIDGGDLLMGHILMHKDKPKSEKMESMAAQKILRKYKKYELIITGDNHIPFVDELDGRFLINCGSMMRMKADQIDHKPRIYHITEKGIKKIFLPIVQGVIDNSHLDVEKQKLERFDAFIKRVDDQYVKDICFEENLKRFFKTNKIRKGVQDVCWEAING